jgi:hypothetical protein
VRIERPLAELLHLLQRLVDDLEGHPCGLRRVALAKRRARPLVGRLHGAARECRGAAIALLVTWLVAAGAPHGLFERSSGVTCAWSPPPARAGERRKGLLSGRHARTKAPQHESYRVGPKVASWPNILSASPCQRSHVGPTFGPSL